MKLTSHISLFLVSGSLYFSSPDSAAQTMQLLQNGGFESHTALPSNLGEWQVMDHWNNAGSFLASPDYYHYLSGAAADIPETPMAIVSAAEGDAIAGLVLSGKNHTNTREYLSSEFTTPLTPGKQYMLGFKITNGYKTETSYAGLGASDIGVYFSTSQPVQVDQSPLLFTPQLVIDSVLYEREWISFNFVFTATQPFSHMTFGIFGVDDDIQIELREGADPYFAYYFVDQFYIEELPDDYDPTAQDPSKGDHNQPGDPAPTVNDIPSPSPFFIPNSFSPNGDGNNEIFIPVGNSLKEWTFEIYSVWGERVFTTEDESAGWDGTFRGDACPNGNYVWQVTYYTYDDLLGPKKITEKGLVVLLR